VLCPVTHAVQVMGEKAIRQAEQKELTKQKKRLRNAVVRVRGWASYHAPLPRGPASPALPCPASASAMCGWPHAAVARYLCWHFDRAYLLGLSGGGEAA
jgi:hypothetical protein